MPSSLIVKRGVLNMVSETVSTTRKQYTTMAGVLRWSGHNRRLRLMPLLWMTAMLTTAANAYTFSDQQNNIHLSLQYNQRSPTYARISDALNSISRARRSVVLEDGVRTENIGTRRDSTEHAPLKSIRSTPTTQPPSEETETEPEVVQVPRNQTTILVENEQKQSRPASQLVKSTDKRKTNETDLLPSVTQQVSKIVTHKLLPAAGGHGKSHKKSHKSVHGGKGGKGHKSFHGHKSAKHGHHSEGGKKGFFDKGGDKKRGHNHEKQYHGSYKGGTKASKGHKEGFKKEHRRGHRDKGFKNKHHKKEYGFAKNFHDEDAFFKHFAHHGLLKDFIKGHKGAAKDFSAHKGHKAHSDHGKKGFFDKGHYHVDDKGHKKQFGNKGYHGYKSSDGHKGHHGR